MLFPFASYEPGDFILHFAGKKGRVRLKLVDYYYPRAIKVRDWYNCCVSLGNKKSASVFGLYSSNVAGEPTVPILIPVRKFTQLFTVTSLVTAGH